MVGVQKKKKKSHFILKCLWDIKNKHFSIRSAKVGHKNFIGRDLMQNKSIFLDAVGEIQII